jgi:hypothetical protein
LKDHWALVLVQRLAQLVEHCWVQREPQLVQPQVAGQATRLVTGLVRKWQVADNKHNKVVSSKQRDQEQVQDLPKALAAVEQVAVPTQSKI